MRPRKTPITLNQTEKTLIRPGLDLIVKSQALAVDNPELLPARKKKEYNKTFARMLRVLRKKLAGNHSGALHLDAVQLSALTLAFRRTRKRLQKKSRQTGKQKPNLTQAMEELEVKLENKRKCAKREAIKRSGKRVYDKRQRNWRTFESWLRAALHVADKESQRRQGPQPPSQATTEEAETPTISPKRLRWQRWQDLIRELIAERMTIQVSESKLPHLVSRLRERMRRSDDDISPDDVVENPEKAKNYAFEYLTKRRDFKGKVKLGFAWMDISIEQSARSPKFRGSTVVEIPEDTADGNQQSARGRGEAPEGSSLSTPLNNSDSGETYDDTSVDGPVKTGETQESAERQTPPIIDGKEVAQTIADWLKEFVRWGEWPEFIVEAQHRAGQAMLEPYRPQAPLSDFDLREHLWSHTPRKGSETWEERKRARAESLARALATGYRSPHDLRGALDDGLKLVLSQVQFPCDRTHPDNNCQ